MVAASPSTRIKGIFIMKVKAKVMGEHPLGIWRQPGEVFEFDGKKDDLGSWMEPFDGKAAKAEPKKEFKKDDGEGGDTTEPPFKAVHRGAGKWDVFNGDLEVVEGGDNLKKEEAHALVEKLIAEAEAAEGEE